jgi:metal-responsive CopG/Arc/MetJ family transcriptional regulator
MAQMNLNLTADFERDLADFMRRRKIKTKSEAIRIAVREALHGVQATRPSFRDALGSLKVTNRKPKFKSEDDLWE